MKNLSLFSLLLTLIVSISAAQPREGRTIELSISGSYQNYSSGSSSSSSGAFLISPRLGFFVAKGLELEPEATLMLSSGSDAVYMLNGNISYNFISAGKGVPFLLIGYGIANSVPLFNVPFSKTDFTVGVLNIGGGVKAFIRDDIALRIEYRFQHFSGQGEPTIISAYSFTRKVDTRIHTVEFGLSILL